VLRGVRPRRHEKKTQNSQSVGRSTINQSIRTLSLSPRDERRTREEARINEALLQSCRLLFVESATGGLRDADAVGGGGQDCRRAVGVELQRGLVVVVVGGHGRAVHRPAPRHPALLGGALRRRRPAVVARRRARAGRPVAGVLLGGAW
jgi:hypothetical protein